MKKSLFIFGILVISLFLVGIVSATQTSCVAESYNSGYREIDSQIVSVSGDAHQDFWTSKPDVYGKWYIDSATGKIVVGTPDLGFSGVYNFTFKYYIGTANDVDTEDFEVNCGSNSYEFQDDVLGNNPAWRAKTISCDFEEGVNYVEFKSLNVGSVHLWKFKVEGEKECPICEDVSIRESLSSTDSGIAIRPFLSSGNWGGWIANDPVPLNERNHQIQYFVDSEKNGLIEDVRVVLKIDNEVLADYFTSVDGSHENTVEFDSTGYCGSHTLSLEIVKNGDCNEDNNYVQREIVVDCGEEPEEPETVRSTGNVLPYSECIPNWECSGWSECSGGVMNRECSDSNFCEFSYNEPLTTTGCVEPVLEDVKVQNNLLSLFIFFGIVLLIILIVLLVNSRG